METSELEKENTKPPAVAKPATFELTVDEGDLDEDQFVSIWNVAASTMKGDQEKTRLLASKLLGFLCKQRCEFVLTSPTDAKYLDEQFESDTGLLYNWKPESEKVDILAQHALVPFGILKQIVEFKKFSIDKAYSPRRADRVTWFSDEWNVG
jgi:hypothetical protein